MWKIKLNAMLAVLSLVGCSPEIGPKVQTKLEGVKMGGTPFGAMESGYRGTVDAMQNFLSCWKAEMHKNVVPNEVVIPKPKVTSSSWTLPPSFVHFHTAANNVGFKSLYDTGQSTSRFLDVNSVKLFRDHAPSDFKVWKDAYGAMSGADEAYYRYDKTQSRGIRLRGSYLDTMLVVGVEHGGAYFLLIPNELSKDGEYEAQILHHGGLIVRFRSFAHLLAHLYLEEREKLNNRDPSLGHLYFYPRPLSETCVGHILTV